MKRKHLERQKQDLLFTAGGLVALFEVNEMNYTPSRYRFQVLVAIKNPRPRWTPRTAVKNRAVLQQPGDRIFIGAPLQRRKHPVRRGVDALEQGVARCIVLRNGIWTEVRGYLTGVI